MPDDLGAVPPAAAADARSYAGCMTIPRRATAILAGLLTVLLVLTGGGLRAGAHGAERAPNVTAHAIMTPASHPLDASCHGPAAKDHCAPSASESACDAMTSCTASVFTAAAMEAAFASAPVHRVPSEPAPEPPTRTTVPELPPPRV